MKLFIVRHGQTDMNVQGLIQSHIDSELNDNGIEQARKVAHRLKDIEFHYAYSSDLKRATNTAKEILKYHPQITLLTTDKLREKKAGILDGMRKSETIEWYNKDSFNFHDFKPEGGESFEEAQSRVGKFYNTLVESHLGENILLVAHGGLIGALLLYILNKPLIWDEYKNHRPVNAALSILEINDTKDHTVHLLNCIEHLEEN